MKVQSLKWKVRDLEEKVSKISSSTCFEGEIEEEKKKRDDKEKRKREEEQRKGDEERRRKNAASFEEQRDPRLLRIPENKRSHSQEQEPPRTSLTGSSTRSVSANHGGKDARKMVKVTFFPSDAERGCGSNNSHTVTPNYAA